ncbi:unnamed protein product [Lepeophtheirus salmonis]|uniref:(salmon louse) hypothetical protein n=1 Tax=Lepeophtheirus salmonis TaxID=72036 RepID=A0A7R8H4Q9_LEPSM|nr:unnamed protein product [Lepeophtheirus salmonis]CAF2865185.1 unnamed protein product [Lepeophtheirus salmonis]
MPSILAFLSLKQTHKYSFNSAKVVNEFTGTCSSGSEGVLRMNECPNGHAHIADSMNCHDFFHCTTVEHAGYALMVKKSCGTFLMFDPFLQNCDWPFRVRRIRPECINEASGERKPYLTRIYTWHPKGKNPLKDINNQFITKKYSESKRQELLSSTTQRFNRANDPRNTTSSPLPSTVVSTTVSIVYTTLPAYAQIKEARSPDPISQKPLTLSKVIPMGKFSLNSLRIFTPQNVTKLREASPKTTVNSKLDII